MTTRTPRMALLILFTAGAIGVARADDGAAPVEDAASPGLLTLSDDTWYEPAEPAEEVAPSRPLQRRSSADDQRVIGASTNGGGGNWVRTLGSLAAVVALIVLLLWGYRMIGGAGQRLTLWGRTRQPFLIDIVAKTPLSNKQSICLVRVGPRLVLVGVGPESMHQLDVIEDESVAAKLLGQAEAQRADSRSAEFNECLASESRMYAAEAGATADNAGSTTRSAAARDALGGVIANLRSKLSGA